MQIEIFTLCDFAQNNAGKTNIIGTFNQIASNVFPFIYNSFNVVGRIGFETSGTKKLKLEILNPHTQNVIPPLEWEVEAPVIAPPFKMSFVDFNFVLNNIQFNEPGIYDVKLYCEDSTKILTLYITQNRS